MKLHTRMFCHPFFNILMFMRGIIVKNQMKLKFLRCLPVKCTQELQKLLMAVPLITLPDDFPIQGIQGCKQGRSPITLIVMSLGFGFSHFQWQSGLSPIKCLNLALFIHTKYQCMFRWIKIQANHVMQFFNETGVAAQLKRTQQMRLQSVGFPYALYGSHAHTCHRSHAASTPMSGVQWFFMQGLLDYFTHLGIFNLFLASWTG